MAETALEILIKPGVPPDFRGEIEDAISEIGCDVAGGGGFADGSASDIMVYVDDVASKLPTIMEILQAAEVGEETIVQQSLPKKREFNVYQPLPDNLVSVADKPWWKFW